MPLTCSVLQLAEVRPSSVKAKEHVSSAAIALTAALFLLISLASFAVFGNSCQSGGSASHAGADGAACHAKQAATLLGCILSVPCQAGS